MCFLAAPLVPLQKTVEADENEDEKYNDDNANFSSFNEVSAEVINDRKVHVITEREIVLLGYGKGRRVEVDPNESVINVFL